MSKSNFKAYRSLLKAISEYGLYAEMSGRHLKIMKDGKMVSTISTTPGDKHIAIDHTLRHLIQDGYLPKINRSNYIHELKVAKS